MAIGVVVVSAGAAVQGVVGFGASLFAVPLLLLVDPRFVPGPAIVGGLALNILMVLGHRVHTDWRGLRWILVGLAPGSALATLALGVFPADDLAILSGGAILLAVALSAFGRAPRRSTGWLLGGGVVSGYMGTTAAVSGPPLALLYQHEAGPTIRGTLPPAFLLSALLALAALTSAGRLTAGDWLSGLALAPGGVIGFFASRRIADRVRGSALRAAVLSISAISAAAAIVRALL